MPSFDFDGVVLETRVTTYNKPARQKFNENATKIVVIGDYFSANAEPPELNWAVAENPDSPSVTSVGLRYGNSGAFTSSITLSEAQARDLSQLEMQVVTSDTVSDADTNFTVTITSS